MTLSKHAIQQQLNHVAFSETTRCSTTILAASLNDRTSHQGTLTVIGRILIPIYDPKLKKNLSY